MGVIFGEMAQAAIFEPLGYLPGGYYYSSASAVSLDGSTVVGSSDWAGTGMQAFRWTSNGGMQGLGDLPGGDFYSRATAVSKDGTVVVGNGTSGVYAAIDGFRWSEDEGISPLGYLPSCDVPYNYAQGVSADGKIIVGGSRSSSAMTSEAYRWIADTGLQPLGDLPGGDYWSIANAISADGDVVVGESKSALAVEAVRWVGDGGPQGLGFPEGITRESLAWAVSPDGGVILGSTESKAWRWTETEGFRFLDVLVSGGQSRPARASWDGELIVGAASDLSAWHAVIWDDVFGVRRLQDVLESKYGIVLDGWRLTAANGISADGTIIVGHGIGPSGRTQAWVINLVIPEPSAAGIIAGVIIFIPFVVRRVR